MNHQSFVLFDVCNHLFFVGWKSERATDATLSDEDWALNMEICDLINEQDDGPRDAVRAIKKRLQMNAGKNHTVVMHSLVVSFARDVRDCQSLMISLSGAGNLCKKLRPPIPCTSLQQRFCTRIG